MDIRGADKATLVHVAIDRALARMNTAIPAIVDSFDPATQTVTVTPAIQAKRVTNEGEVEYNTLGKIANVPVVFPFASSSGFALTLPIAAGDECLLVFSQRAIDNWHDRGGVQPPETDGPGGRHHNMADAFALFAPASSPNVLAAWDAMGIQLRNKLGTMKVTVTDTDVSLEATPSKVVVSATGTVITGNLYVIGTITHS